MKKEFSVVSHTHWDREWYMSLEKMRFRLVDLIDRCLVTLSKYPQYIFHLDAQTIVLEDYLTVRPGKRGELEQYIKQGRLIVGPWYLQNDFYLTSGEATVRNLLEGEKIAEEFGACAKVGYVPDQFGNISQLPQILNNFGIDNTIFGRGNSYYTKNEQGQISRVPQKSEFIWEGADGSKLLGVYMMYWYNNAQRFSENLDTAKLLIDVIDKSFEGVALTPYILCMNGVDHLEAQDNLLPILEKLNANLEEGRKVKQVTMKEYIEKIKSYIEQNNIQPDVYKGEMRHGHTWEILKGTLSSRIYLKKANVIAQNMMETMLEPVYSFLEENGAKGAYCKDHLNFVWKEIMKNHPHDSICGCSRDELHKHMEDNFERIDDMQNDLLNRGLVIAAEHSKAVKTGNKDDYAIVGVNTLEKEFNGVVKVVLDIRADDNYESIEIFDLDNKPVDFAVISKNRIIKDVFTPINLPGCVDVDRFELYLYETNINPFAIKSYTVKKSNKPYKCVKEIENADKVMENEYLKVKVNADGKVDIFDKVNGFAFENAIDIEETTDRGDSYIYGPSDDRAIYGSEFDAETSVKENNEYVQAISIKRTIKVPAEYDFSKLERSKETVDCDMELILSLKKASKTVEIDYVLENRAKDHRIRLLVNTGIKSLVSTSDIPFDIVHKEQESNDYIYQLSKENANTSFALLENEGKGLAVFNLGNHDYEHVGNSLAFTLVRSTGVINRDLSDYQFKSGEVWTCPGNQCIRTLTGRLGIYSYSGNYISADVFGASKRFRTPAIFTTSPVDVKKFSCGRSAVQDSNLTETFYLPDPYE